MRGKRFGGPVAAIFGFGMLACASREPAVTSAADAAIDVATDVPVEARDASPDAGGDDGLPPIDMTGPIGGARPAEIKLPDHYNASEPDPEKRHPLIVLLHGYGATGILQDFYLKLSREANPLGYVVALPDGTPDSTAQRFWNASDACCDLDGLAPDDVAYVRDLVRQIVARYAVDPGRVYLFGHSNGAFLTLRLACEQTKRFAAVVALAGATWADTSRCAPTEPIGVLTIHGTADATIPFGGGAISHRNPAQSFPFPSAETTIATFAARNGCEKAATKGDALDLVDDALGAETKPSRYGSCKTGVSTELWPLEGAGHVPTFGPAFLPSVFAFLQKHARR